METRTIVRNGYKHKESEQSGYQYRFNLSLSTLLCAFYLPRKNLHTIGGETGRGGVPKKSPARHENREDFQYRDLFTNHLSAPQLMK